MKVFSTDVLVWATAYIKANDRDEALQKLQGLQNRGLELPVDDDEDADVAISGRSFDDPELPTVSLSPAMAIDGAFVKGIQYLWEVE